MIQESLSRETQYQDAQIVYESLVFIYQLTFYYNYPLISFPLCHFYFALFFTFLRISTLIFEVFLEIFTYMDILPIVFSQVCCDGIVLLFLFIFSLLTSNKLYF